MRKDKNITRTGKKIGIHADRQSVHIRTEEYIQACTLCRKPTGCKMSKRQGYLSVYLKGTGITARSGKQAYISREHHERIRRIVQTIGNNEISMSDYIYNVLERHFEEYRDEISESVNNHLKTINI